tara:strand:+ start:15229 stop:15435 length:207 start_codon:yes stop_codon:yes gene_type:complete
MRIKRENLIQAIDELLSETNTTGAMIGGAGPIKTPKAFTGKGKKNKSLAVIRKYLTDFPRTFKHTKKL